jgi:hypothetical protein
MTLRLRARGARRAAARAAALGALAALSACQDLDVANPNDPDRERVQRLPSSVEGLASTSFRGWWPWVHDDSPVWAMATMADDFTAAFFDFGILVASAEPRVAYDNSQTYADRFVNESPWYGLYATLAATNDVLAALDRGVRIGTDAETARTRAVARFVQGLCTGYLALYFDRAWVVTEKVRADTLTVPGTTRLKGDPLPYRQVMDSAQAMLADAARLADAGPAFTLPEGAWLHQAMDNRALARLARSYRARLLAQVARTRAERDGVNWALVSALVDSGTTVDFAPVAVPGVFVDDFRRVAARSRTAIPGDFARVDNAVVGPADSTGAFLAWVSTPLSQRRAFQLRTRDRRIQGAAVGSDGRYIGYTNSNRFQDSRGTYHQSRYWYRRLGTLESWQNGPQPELLRAEMDLLKAEALLRLNRAADAVPLVNRTRVANGELPPVTVEGPPNTAGCVPRKLDGTCGSLWDALRYEKRLEILGIHPPGGYLDARGWQALAPGTPVHLPIPGRELATVQRPLYSFGGGGEGSAPAPAAERCPVALPRCP